MSFPMLKETPSPKRRREMNGRSARPELRERVSHLMSHPWFFFLFVFFIISLQAHGFIFGGRQGEKKHRILASDGVREGATAAAPVNH